MIDPDLDGGREHDFLGCAVIAVVGAALSLAVTGFVFGTNNNQYHLPIIGRLYDEPQFDTDAYIQSLRFFAAGPFLLLQGADRYVDPAKLFLVLDYVSRLLSYVGFLACARLLGVTSRRDRSLFAVLLAFTSLLQGGSFAGGGGLFLSYFTHSEMANGLSLIALSYAARGRLTEAFAANGLVFFTNAFVAVWNAVPLGFMACLLVAQGRLGLGRALRRGGIGLVLFLLLASPVIANVLSNPQFGQPTSFDYRSFLRGFWPFHFFFWSNSRGGRLALAAVAATGLLAFSALSKRDKNGGADRFQAALLGYLSVYGIGILVPFVTGSAAILNLHLLRSGGLIHLLAALGGLALATNWQISREPAASRIGGPLLIASLCTVKTALFLAPIVIAGAMLAPMRRITPRWLLGGRPLLPIFVAALLLGCWSVLARNNYRANAATNDGLAQWAELGRWARANTPPDALFLIPIARKRDGGQITGPPQDGGELWLGSEIFDYASHRRVWVDLRRGAAVMWSPSYYPIWKQRVDELRDLSSLKERLASASRNDIRYVVDWCAQGDQPTPLYQTRQFCVFDVPPHAAAGSGQ